MSRYYAGTVVLNKSVFENIQENVKEKIYKKIENLGISNKYNVVYGFDHACLYFIQFENISPESDDDIVVDIDTIFDGLLGRELGYILKQILPHDALRHAHCSKAYLDMEF